MEKVEIKNPLPIVSATDVVKTYRSGDLEVPALKGVSLSIYPGEFVAIMGPSGNGKSTLLNCLSGIDTIDSGKVEIGGESIFEMRDSKRTKMRAQKMGFIFQGFNLIPVFTAIENVELPLLAAGAKPAKARKRANEILDRVGLSDRKTHRPPELSGGQQQRVAIARALVAEPNIIWADEPTGNLDSATAAQILELLSQINNQGQTVVMVTHDRHMANRANRIIRVSDGLVETSASDQSLDGGVVEGISK